MFSLAKEVSEVLSPFQELFGQQRSWEKAIVIGIDETLERRWGIKIWGRGIYRDAVKSSAKHQVKSSGVRWQVMQVLLPLPWSQRVWGLPFLSVMVPSKETPRVGARGYKSSLDWATQMVSVVSKWLQRSWVCVADGGYGNAKFGWACRRHGVSLVARLPKDRLIYMTSRRRHHHADCGVVLAPKAHASYRCNNSLRLLNSSRVDFRFCADMVADILCAN
jgi:DDE superfamily endonuclease